MLSTAFWPNQIYGCSVCFGAADSPVIQAIKWGILVLLAILLFVFACLGNFFYQMHKRGQSPEPK